MSKFKVGDKVQFKLSEDDTWDTEVYTVVDEHPLGYTPKGTLVGISYRPDGDYSEYITLHNTDVEYRLVSETNREVEV